ncbi:MAG: LD-carboxypeptidase [Parasphingorhabdus sp.]
MKRKQIGICAPSTPISREDADQVIALAARTHPDAKLIFSDQCFANAGHFAGDDHLRCNGFVQMANDPRLDAIWFARGGYGAVRIAEEALIQLEVPANDKLYMGYSDGGNLLAALYKASIGQQAHGPMPIDIKRDNGEKVVERALNWIVSNESESLEPHIKEGDKYAAFNLTTLAMLTGTSQMPDLTDHIVMIEEVSEYLYSFDRAMFNITNHLAGVGLKGLRLGQVTGIPENDRPFGQTEEEITRFWCDRYQIPYLGRADIGHDANNHIVPFGNAVT